MNYCHKPYQIAFKKLFINNTKYLFLPKKNFKIHQCLVQSIPSTKYIYIFLDIQTNERRKKEEKRVEKKTPFLFFLLFFLFLLLLFVWISIGILHVAFLIRLLDYFTLKFCFLSVGNALEEKCLQSWQHHTERDLWQELHFW